MTISADVQVLEPGAVVELYELDIGELGGSTLRFHAHLTAGSIWWQGYEYAPWPMQCVGFARTSSGAGAPTVNISNIDGTITALCMAYDDLVGARFTRHRTLSKYLDAVNFPGGINPTADPTQEMPPEIWYVERKVVEEKEAVQFELASGMDLNGMQLPRRQIVANKCLWLTIGGYRGAYCNYSGPPVAKADGTPTSDPALDKCGGTVSDCKLRFGETGQLRHGGFPAAGLIR